ncbi:DUF2079 domain-containing protein [Corallococcus llansteffanensis]|uniref:DUF2079 domain-containing protein n=1 Tax=Corallococcus llansteffanensis TaxID=2316731 RepID=UPI0013159C30|nr:DUF2079 domain-containing protein [Corallococcus llansteffanensis]
MYTVACVWTAFRGGVFAFHDLALLNDLFSNAVHRGRPFWVTDADLNHLTVHFTPTLLLLTPLFLLSDSQFLFVLLGLVALYGAVALQVWFFERMFEEQELLPAAWRPWASVAFAVYLALNPFVKTVALSAHFEVFFQLGATAVLVLLLRGARMRWVVLAALLALGVRPDGGLFLAFQSAALLLLPAVARPPRALLTRRALGVSALSLGYLALCVAVVLPALGTPSGTRFWSHYGNTWGQVAFTALGDPGRVVHDVSTSGLVVFQRSFLWIQLLVPAATLLSTLPGTFFFMADAPDKRLLWFYNSAFLLPGLGVCAAAGFGRLAEAWRDVLARGRIPAWAKAAPALLIAGLALAQVARFDRTIGSPRLRPMPPVDGDFREALARQVQACASRRVVATDFRSVVFVPNGYDRFLLHHYERAQVVLVPPHVETLLLGAGSREAFLEVLQRDARFEEVEDPGPVRVFVRKDARSCGS